MPSPRLFDLKAYNPMQMVIAPEDAATFIEGYKAVLTEIGHLSPGKPQTEILKTLIGARSKYIADRSLLDRALAALSEKPLAPAPEVVSAMRSLQIKRWIYLKDTRSHSIFMDPDSEVAYGVLGLTNRIRDIIGASGAVIETGLVQYQGHYVCDGLISDVVWLGPNYKRSFTSTFANIRARGHFYKTPAG